VAPLKGLVASGQFTPVRRRPAPTLDDMSRHTGVETQEKIGNVVITLPVTG
jgi:hypothetical protein